MPDGLITVQSSRGPKRTIGATEAIDWPAVLIWHQAHDYKNFVRRPRAARVELYVIARLELG